MSFLRTAVIKNTNFPIFQPNSWNDESLIKPVCCLRIVPTQVFGDLISLGKDGFNEVGAWRKQESNPRASTLPWLFLHGTSACNYVWLWRRMGDRQRRSIRGTWGSGGRLHPTATIIRQRCTVDALGWNKAVSYVCGRGIVSTVQDSLWTDAVIQEQAAHCTLMAQPISIPDR